MTGISFKKLFSLTISIVLLISIMLTSCTLPSDTEETENPVYEIINGGFETGDLTGWTMEYGTAFSDDNVASLNDFFFSNDSAHNIIPMNKTGSWHLYGRGYDETIGYERKGAIRSSVFTLGGNGTVSMNIAGAAPRYKGENGAAKDPFYTCYVGIYLVEDDRMIHKQLNEYFLEHTTDYVEPDKYATGVFNTDNYNKYTVDLSAHMGEKMYIRIVDNDDSYYYGYISVDNIRTYSGSSEQETGTVYTKIRSYAETAVAPENDIINGGFETGSLAGWEIVSGTAFSNRGVNSSPVWWNENITYNRDGNYHYGLYQPSATGVMRSSVFTLSGSGYISYKLGGCSDSSKTYLRVMEKSSDGGIEIYRLTNYKYKDFNFPHAQNGMRLLNMTQYYVDASAHIGKELYFEIVDENTSNSDLGCITLDSVIGYYKEKPVFGGFYYEGTGLSNELFEYEPVSEYQVKNGTFETGDLTGWTLVSGETIGAVTSDNTWWVESYPYFKSGKYLFSGIAHESGMGVLESEEFVIGKSGWMSFKLGGGGNPHLAYLSVVESGTGTELFRFANTMFKDYDGWGYQAVGQTIFLANMAMYKADLSAHMGKTVKIRIVDNATSAWGLLTVDSIITDNNEVPASGITAKNILAAVEGEQGGYELYNGGFETGDLSGWTSVSGNLHNNDFISVSETWWRESIPFNMEGNWFFNGLKNEGATGTIRSSNFKVGGLRYITFKMGGAKNQGLVYISVKKVSDNSEVARFSNSEFADVNFPDYNNGMNLGNMVQYIYQFGVELAETELYIEIVDNASEDWGLITVDSIKTYYTEAPVFINAYQAINIKP